MMGVTIDINGREINSFAIRNVGHPKTGDHPEDDDLREYHWTSIEGGSGAVLHHREDGAEDLAVKVIESWIWSQ